ncbi:MAG TPA: class I SAM-dependent methyltransferase [Polyangia bacterium]|jgi:SAM-dependent methyltransferase|nr:class I SAM-dependent methyltransferase [Polyangia bacterium]
MDHQTGRGDPSGATAFDAIADRYDALFSPEANPLIPLVRERVYRALGRHFPAGSTLLELGCGTGEDTLALVERGYQIVACDPAPAMLAQAEAKLRAAGRSAAGRFVGLGVEELAARWPSLGVAVDGVFSNFAPLNCALSLDPVRRLLEQALAPGGRFVGVVLPRVCPLEIALFLARGDLRTAFRRFRRHPIADVEGRRFAMRYYGAGDFDRALAGMFGRVETRSLGLCLPPLSLGPSFARVPGLLPALAALEDVVGGWPGLRRAGDHVLLAYERA